MTPRFSVVTTSAFDRRARKLRSRHTELVDLLARAFDVLSVDPTNRSGQHDIKKLADVAVGEGQWRLRLGRWRFRYDFADEMVMLLDAALRSEATYRR